MKFYNTLTRHEEDFVPLNPPKVGMYTCGPTVYDYPHIGNWRMFVFEDILRRALRFEGYEVTQVMNITDVGHLTGDNVGDADVGEDRMEKAAKREKKSAWDIAKFYLDDFVVSTRELNIEAPEFLPRATDHIQEQINLVQTLLEKGFAYQTSHAIYFDVSKFPEYGKLGGQKLQDKRVATREELVEDPEKRHPFDFALWKFSPPFDAAQGGGATHRQMEWKSPWGVGFPGWHIECSAMSMKYLGGSFDIHTGGVDHVAIHHTNEIAQSEGATGKPFAKYWLHGEFLRVDGGRMGKSLGNAYTLHDIKAKGFSPLALRYFYLTGHYRKPVNFTWDVLQAAQTALQTLYDTVARLRDSQDRVMLSPEKLDKVNAYRQQFTDAMGNDLNIPQTLAILWEVVKSNIPDRDKYDLLIEFDQVWGLGLDQARESVKIMAVDSLEAGDKTLVIKRQELKQQGHYAEADAIRKELAEKGILIEDTKDGIVIKRVV